MQFIQFVRRHPWIVAAITLVLGSEAFFPNSEFVTNFDGLVIGVTTAIVIVVLSEIYKFLEEWSRTGWPKFQLRSNPRD
jgi:hypothetical protein